MSTRCMGDAAQGDLGTNGPTMQHENTMQTVRSRDRKAYGWRVVNADASCTYVGNMGMIREGCCVVVHLSRSLWGHANLSEGRSAQSFSVPSGSNRLLIPDTQCSEGR